MDNNKVKLAIIIGAVVAVLLAVGAVVFVLVRNNQGTTPAGTQTVIDPDTGDEITVTPGKQPEFAPTQEPNILGGAKMIDATPMSFRQYEMIKSITIQYARQNVGESVDVIKFLPDSIELIPNTQYAFRVDIKTGNPEAIFKAEVSLISTDRVQMKITYPAKPELGTFDSGVIPPYNDTTQDLDHAEAIETPVEY